MGEHAMTWTELLKAEAESAYGATEGLIKMVDADGLDWKPADGANWMTTGQLLKHILTACGFCCRGFVTGDWGMPEGTEMTDLPPEEMLPPAEKMPTVASIEEALEGLAADRKLAFEMIDEVGEEGLGTRMTAAPWNPQAEFPIGRHILHMIGHLESHKAQLYYYLKLQGKPVHTGTLWGM
jgi:uncharacterized damage-inducible protein DinB